MLEPITLQHGKPGDVGMDPARIELIRTRARSWVANDDTRSVVLLVARRGVIVLKEASDAWDQGAGGATSISHLGALVSNFWADPDAGVVGVG